MLNITSQTKIYAYTKAADMRKGFNGLSGIIRSEFQSDPTDGSLFVFVNRRRDRMKLLHFDGGGFGCIIVYWKQEHLKSSSPTAIPVDWKSTRPS